MAALGDRALVCLDTGHHAPGTNIEFIVAQLLRLREARLVRLQLAFYADDDLIVGAADPFQLFRIMFEVIRGGGFGTRQPDVAFMLDQCHNIEEKIPGQIRSVLNVQEMTARALLVDTDALTAAQDAGDVLARQRASSWTPSTPTSAADLADWREAARPAREPDARPTLDSGYQEQIEADRVGGTQAGWD